MRCPGCGNELKAQARFCTKCGAPVPQEMNAEDDSANIENSNVLPKEKGMEKKPFVWQDKYTYMVIAFGMVLVAGIGIAVKMNKTSRMQEEAAAANGEYMYSNRETGYIADGSDNSEVFPAEEEMGSAADDQIQGSVQETFQKEEPEEESLDDIEKNDVGIHTYELVVADVTWTEAYESCLRMGGYLVRINSGDEYDAILKQIEDEDKHNIKFWIGGYRDNGREYRWVYNDDFEGKDDFLPGNAVINSDPLYKDYWFEGEPSFYDEATETEENRMNMFYIKSLGRWGWNDVPDDILAVADFYAGTIGYICEFD